MRSLLSRHTLSSSVFVGAFSFSNGSCVPIFSPSASVVILTTLATPSSFAFLHSLSLTSSTNLPFSTSTPSFSACPSGSPISLIFTFPSLNSSSPKITANGTPPTSAALNCAGSFGLFLYANSALMPASHSVRATSIRSSSRPVKPLPPKAMTKTSTSLMRTFSRREEDAIRALVIEKMRSTPKEMPTQGICARPENMPTSSS